jgi:hypothetical protein
MLRTRPAAAFALLNHILINGFFFNQGFAIRLFPSNTLLDFVQSRKLSHHSVHARSPNEGGAEPQGEKPPRSLRRKNRNLTSLALPEPPPASSHCSPVVGVLVVQMPDTGHQGTMFSLLRPLNRFSLCLEAAENAIGVVLDDIALDGCSFRPSLRSRFHINICHLTCPQSPRR